MNNHLYRGKRKDKPHEWVEGDLVHNYIHHATGTSIVSAGGCLWNEVIPESVGLASPFTDKNGVRIFEGDILSAWEILDGERAQSKRQVFFDVITGQWMLDCSFFQTKTFGVPLFQELLDGEYEITSSIHD